MSESQHDSGVEWQEDFYPDAKQPAEEVVSEEDFSFNGNAGIEDMGHDLLNPPVESEDAKDGDGGKIALGAVNPEERRAEAINIATTLPNASVSELLSAAYQIEEYLISGREKGQKDQTPTE